MHSPASKWVCSFFFPVEASWFDTVFSPDLGKEVIFIRFGSNIGNINDE
jgi:hypothetical protein